MTNDVIKLNDLPNEMIYTIFSFIKPSLSNLINYHIINNDIRENINKIRMLAILRIQLAFKIKHHARKLKNKVLGQLNRMMKMSPPITSAPRGDCVYYAPHIPGAHCRFCYGYKHEHKISERLILKYYLPYILPMYPDERYNH